MDDLPTITHHFKVQFTHPVKSPRNDGSEYTGTMFLGVSARTIDEAIAAVREAYPRATIYTVSHQGKIQIQD